MTYGGCKTKKGADDLSTGTPLVLEFVVSEKTEHTHTSPRLEVVRAGLNLDLSILHPEALVHNYSFFS